MFLATQGSQTSALYSTIGLTRALYARSLDLAEQVRRLRRTKVQSLVCFGGNFIYMTIPALNHVREVDPWIFSSINSFQDLAMNFVLKCERCTSACYPYKVALAWIKFNTPVGFPFFQAVKIILSLYTTLWHNDMSSQGSNPAFTNISPGIRLIYHIIPVS